MCRYNYIFFCNFAAVISPDDSFDGSSLVSKTQRSDSSSQNKELQKLNDRIVQISQQIHKQYGIKVEYLDDFYKNNSLPTIFIITPTYSRPVQKAELTRLSQTFRLVPKLHWILVEDRANKSSLVQEFLYISGLSYTHLNYETPADYKLKESDPNWLKPRGALQRNKGLSWLRSRSNNIAMSGVVYFADDDNTYDIELFNEVIINNFE